MSIVRLLLFLVSIGLFYYHNSSYLLAVNSNILCFLILMLVSYPPINLSIIYLYIYIYIYIYIKLNTNIRNYRQNTTYCKKLKQVVID